MINYIKTKMAAFFTSIGNGIIPFAMGAMFATVLLGWAHTVSVEESLKQRLPEVLESDAQQLPPNATNLRGLGNRWILFDLEINGEKKIFIFRRGEGGRCNGTPDVLTQIK